MPCGSDADGGDGDGDVDAASSKKHARGAQHGSTAAAGRVRVHSGYLEAWESLKNGILRFSLAAPLPPPSRSLRVLRGPCLDHVCTFVFACVRPNTHLNICSLLPFFLRCHRPNRAQRRWRVAGRAQSVLAPAPAQAAAGVSGTCKVQCHSEATLVGWNARRRRKRSPRLIPLALPLPLPLPLPLVLPLPLPLPLALP